MVTLDKPKSETSRDLRARAEVIDAKVRELDTALFEMAERTTGKGFTLASFNSLRALALYTDSVIESAKLRAESNALYDMACVWEYTEQNGTP